MNQNFTLQPMEKPLPTAFELEKDFVAEWLKEHGTDKDIRVMIKKILQSDKKLVE